MVEPYLNLDGRAAEAIDFYETVFGGTNMRVMKVGDMPKDPNFPDWEEGKDRIAHAQMEIRGTNFNFSDMQPGVEVNGKISLMVRFASAEELAGVYTKLLEGGFAMMELAPTPFAKSYAWIADKFGIGWQLIFE